MHRHVPASSARHWSAPDPAVSSPCVRLDPTVGQHTGHSPATARWLPNFLLIGVQRAGTTLLHRILEAHPEVYVPYRRKEVHYFDWYFDRGVQWYEEFFPERQSGKKYTAIGEVTPDYIFERDVPARIHQLLPDCRFIVSLRNPVDRAYSEYRYVMRSNNEQRGFGEFLSANIETVQRGFYSEQLARYLERFPRSAFLILLYEELVADPATQLDRIRAFLGLGRGWEDPEQLLRERVNSSEIPRFQAAFAAARGFGALLTRYDLDWIVRLAKRNGIPQLFGRRASDRSMPEAARRRLEELYGDEIAILEDMLGCDLSVWRAGFSGAGRATPEPRTRAEVLARQ